MGLHRALPQQLEFALATEPDRRMEPWGWGARSHPVGLSRLAPSRPGSTWQQLLLRPRPRRAAGSSAPIRLRHTEPSEEQSLRSYQPSVFIKKSFDIARDTDLKQKNHRIIKVGKDLQDHPVQPSPQHPPHAC